VKLLKDKLTELTELIHQGESRQLDMSLPKVSATVGKLFLKYIPIDARRKVEDYSPKIVDFHILGKKEALKRIGQLVDYETRTTIAVLDKALIEARAMLNNPTNLPTFPPRAAKDVYIKHGAFYSGDNAVFLSGLYGRLPKWFKAEENLSDLKHLGANFVGPLSVKCYQEWIGEDEHDPLLLGNFIDSCRSYEKHGFYLSALVWLARTPKWLKKSMPDIDVESHSFLDGTEALVNQVKGWFRNYIDIDHPMTEEFHSKWFKYIAEHFKASPNLLTYSIMGEEWCMPTFRSKYTRQRYSKWLEKKYVIIDKLNSFWQADYKTFYAAATPESENTKGGHYDWFIFNEYRLTCLNQWQIDAIRKVDPQASVAPWPGAGGLLNSPPGGLDSVLGRDREAIIRQSSGVVSWDGGILPYESGATTKNLPNEHWNKYNMGWRDEMIYYDFSKSICPEKPIFDPELHTATAWHSMLPFGISADFFRTAFWLQHLHGLGAHLLWNYTVRNQHGTPRMLEFLGSILTQPQLLDAWGRTTLELRRLAKYIVLFPQLERRVKILYSEASGIQHNQAVEDIDEVANMHDDIYANHLMKIYEALYFLDYQVGFTTEKTIATMGLKDCSLLVIPNTQYVSDKTVEAIKNYLATGGCIIMMGLNALKYDEYGNERDISFFQNNHSLYLKGSSPEEYAPQLDQLMNELDIKRPIRGLDKDNKSVWGIEIRVAETAESYIIYLINQNKYHNDIYLTMTDMPNNALDLIHNKIIAINKPLTVNPRQPILLELKK
jgi:Beta-galactosidase